MYSLLFERHLIHWSLSMFRKFVLIRNLICRWWRISNHLKFDMHAHKKVGEIDAFKGKASTVCFRQWSSHDDKGNNRFNYVLKTLKFCICVGVRGSTSTHLVWEGVPGEENRKNADVSLVMCCFCVSVSIYLTLISWLKTSFKTEKQCMHKEAAN